MSDNSYQLFAKDYYTVASSAILKITNTYIKKYNFINNDEGAFKFEFLILIFHLTMQKLAKVFNDVQKELDILDNLHNTYYGLLKSKSHISDIELEKICGTINKRYRDYETVINDDNFVFNISTKFLDNIDSYHGANFAKDIRSIFKVGLLIDLYFTATKDAFLTLKGYHEI